MTLTEDRLIAAAAQMGAGQAGPGGAAPGAGGTGADDVIDAEYEVKK